MALKVDKKEVLEEGVWIEDFLVKVTEDGMFLYLEFEKEDKDGIKAFLGKWKDIRQKLIELGFCGVLQEPVVKDGVIFVARGKPAVAPQPGIVDFFSEYKSILNKLLPTSEDLREVNKIICAKKGEVIGKWIPPQDGIPGKNVFCEEIPPPEKKEKDCEIGEGLKVNEKGEIVAEISGVVQVEDKKIFVEPEYELRGDVDYSVGNIKFFGQKLTIRGDVKYGFRVEVEEGDLELAGGTENKVFILVKGNFYCSGIVRGEETSVIVKGNAEVKAVEYAKLEVEGKLIIKDYLIFGTAMCMKDILVKEGKGMVYGGVTRAKGNIEVKEAGNESQTPTKIIAGYHPKVIESYLKIIQEKLLIEETLKKLQKGIELGKKLKETGKLDEKKREILKQIEEQFNLYSYRLETLEDKLQDLRKEMAELKTKVVKIWSKVYPGVTIGIADVTTTVPEERRGPIKFKLEASIIKVSELKERP